ncbi:MAG: hypothetical protein LC808_20930, partial [Actinobacteria bacterium]|nr:hypothetical protein [Actinomycetota bacterium]
YEPSGSLTLYPWRTMPDEPKDEPTQRTPEGAERDRLNLPGEGGTVITVPEREDVERALRKVAQPAQPGLPSRGRRRRSRPKE